MMNTFDLILQSGSQYEKITEVVSFIGEDKSGKFGMLAYHSRMMTCLCFGLAEFRYQNNEKEYVALPGGVLYFVDNQLFIGTRHYIKSKDYHTIISSLDKELQHEEENVRSIKESLHRLDEEILKRLWHLKQNIYET